MLERIPVEFNNEGVITVIRTNGSQPWQHIRIFWKI